MFLRLMAVGGMSAVLGLGAFSPRYVVDNQNETITFSAEELNNNTYQYLADQLNNLDTSDLPIELEQSTITMGNETFIFENLYTDTNIYYLSTSGNYQLGLYLDATDNDYGKWYLFDQNEDDYVQFTQSITINNAQWFIDNLYEPQSMPDILVDFVEVLVGGIVSLAEGIASGVVSMAGALFLEYDNGALVGLSVFGGIIAIFSGLALAVSLTTKVYTWVTSLGN